MKARQLKIMVILIAKQQSIVPLLRSLTAAIIIVVVHVYKYSIRFRSRNHCQWSCCFTFLSSKMQSQCVFWFMSHFISLFGFQYCSTLLELLVANSLVATSTAPSIDTLQLQVELLSTTPIFDRLYSNSKRQHCIFEMR